MRGVPTVIPNGELPELMAKTERQGSVTPEGIAEISHTDALPVEAVRKDEGSEVARFE